MSESVSAVDPSEVLTIATNATQGFDREPETDALQTTPNLRPVSDPDALTGYRDEEADVEVALDEDSGLIHITADLITDEVDVSRAELEEPENPRLAVSKNQADRLIDRLTSSGIQARSESVGDFYIVECRPIDTGGATTQREVTRAVTFTLLNVYRCLGRIPYADATEVWPDN